ncbi:LamB/YcsF family protein, partial [Staphylococcus aureus]|nr:LamB/YcsF family protein [Staphylococcus aureus]
EALKQVLNRVKENKVISKNNNEVTLQAHTICLHADAQHALLFVSKIREILMKEGIDIQSL